MIAAAVEGMVTVGTMMKYEHTAPGIIGATVRVEAEVAQIGTGEHTRRIVNRQELVKRAHDRVDKMARNHP